MEAVSAATHENVPIGELVQLGATDGPLFSQTFFSRTVRQSVPQFHHEIWAALDDPLVRYFNCVVSRDGAKTTLLRLFAAKRIAYNVSRTILYVGASEGHASRSVRWLKRAVEFNKLYAGTFGLRPGSKWQESEIEIYHGVDEAPIWILGVGITGNIRGINFDDYRPDLIILDDILTDENAATLEQREKVSNIVFGALKESLAPATEEPNAKLVMLTTPQHRDDVVAQAQQDRQFRSVTHGCWTPETMDLPTDEQISNWPDRHPSETLREEKKAAIARNRLSIFLREKECRLISPEACSFRMEWLNMLPADQLPKGAHCVIAIDPVPPPSETQMRKALKGKDFEAITVVGRHGGNYYMLEEAENRGHEPNWTVAKVFELILKHRPVAVVVESVGYQRVLKGLLEAEMQRRKMFVAVVPYVDTRAKFTRITGAFSGIASQGKLFVNNACSRFITQYGTYGPTHNDHDDVLDSAAIGISQIMVPALEDGLGDIDSSNVTPMKWRRGAP